MKEEKSSTILLPTIPPTGSDGTAPRILVVEGPLEGREYAIGKFPYTIGSALANDLSIADSTVSRHHCEITMEADGTLVIKDLGSTNGTAIEGVKVTSAHLLPNTTVQLGRTRIIVPLVYDHAELTMSPREQFGTSTGRTPLMRHVFYLAEQAAACDSAVLLVGESGTGKEELAENIHDESARKNEPFIVSDCAMLTSFDHAYQEFFGSDTQKGVLELASGGSLFIDSIDRLPADAQPLLLRTIETRKDIRFLAATKKDISQLANGNAFYKPLFSAISIIVIELPALRRRKEDIPLLLTSIAERLHAPENIKQWCEQPSIIAFLRRYNWPGNIRELYTLIEKMISLGNIPADIGAFLQNDRFNTTEDATFKLQENVPFKDLKIKMIEDFERRYLSDLLARNAQNITKSAQSAGIERAYLQRLVRKYGMRTSHS